MFKTYQLGHKVPKRGAINQTTVVAMATEPLNAKLVSIETVLEALPMISLAKAVTQGR